MSFLGIFGKATAAATLGEIAITDDGDDIVKVEGVAYSGGKMKVGMWNHPIVIDLAGATIPAEIPFLIDHENYVASRIGITTATTDGKSLAVAGKIFKKNEGAVDIVAQMSAGADWQLSIGAEVVEHELVKEGKKRTINGKEQVGPFYHMQKTVIREISILAVGADVDTRLKKVAASFVLTLKGGQAMPDEIKKDETKKDETAKAAMDETLHGEVAAMIAEALAPVMSAIEEVKKLIGGEMEKKESGPATGGEQQPAEMAAAKVGKLEARLFDLEGFKAATQKEKTVAGMVIEAKMKLAKKHIDERLEAKLYKMAGTGKETFDDFVDELKVRMPDETPSDIAGIEAGLIGIDDEESESLSFFSAFGPDVAASARKHARSYAELKQIGHVNGIDIRTHVVNQLRASGVDVKKMETLLTAKA